LRPTKTHRFLFPSFLGLLGGCCCLSLLLLDCCFGLAMPRANGYNGIPQPRAQHTYLFFHLLLPGCVGLGHDPGLASFEAFPVVGADGGGDLTVGPADLLETL